MQQFGGVSATHLDWTMVPYVRKSFLKHFKDGLKYIENKPDGFIEKILGNADPDKVSIDHACYKVLCPQTYKYAMDKTIDELNQAVEGMYHNLNTL